MKYSNSLSVPIPFRGSSYRAQHRISSVSLSIPMPPLAEMEPVPVAEQARARSGSLDSVDAAFYPHRLTLWVFGRFPFAPGRRSRLGAKINDFGQPGVKTAPRISTRAPYSQSVLTFHWLYFVITSIFIAWVLVMLTLGFANDFLLRGPDPEPESPTAASVTEGNQAKEEEHKIRHNLVAFVLFWSCLFHSTVSNISFWRNRRRIVAYLNHWNAVMDALGIHVPSAIKRFLTLSNVWYGGFLLLVLGSYTFNFHKISRGASVMVTTHVLGPFLPDIHCKGSFGGWYLFGLFTLVYGIYASRSMLFLYLFKTRLLRHAFKVWNGRLRALLAAEGDEGKGGTSDEKALCEKLYADHVTLLTLVKQTDRVFDRILQSYYASQILNMCFELYFLARFGNISQRHTDSDVDQSDIVAAFALLFQTVILFFTISLDAAFVSEEAMKGFELLRGRGIRMTDSVAKKYLFYSLEMSYSQRIVLTGGKFFSIDRPFIITVLGAVFTYFIIILQFGIGNYAGANA